MKIKKIKLEKFKRVELAEFDLDNLNVIIGGNNSGKSSILQGIHFSVTVSAIARQQQLETFSSDLLLYNPTPEFELLKNGAPYRNGGDDKSSELEINGINNDNENPVNYRISIYKGRNHGNIGCQRGGDQPLGQLITDSSNLFSIYVPGLAGIPRSEELKSKAIVRRGVASGDANIYLRNVIYYIKETRKLDELNKRLGNFFPGMTVKVSFDEENDTFLKVLINIDGRDTPLELIGTGVLQILQILSYITYFNPRLLLLDEPDSHLHPNNQVILTDLLTLISEETSTQILLCTHSRHIIDSLYGKANFIWMKDGKVKEEGYAINRLPLLIDIGALDNFDKFRQGSLDAIILTEDRDTTFLTKLLLANGFDLKRILFYSYKTSSNLETLSLFVDFIKEVSNDCNIVVHRDRDFMLEEEVEIVKNKIISANAIPFITTGSDIESYFINISHISVLLCVNESVVRDWVDELATKNHIQIQHEYTRKRDEIKNTLYSRKNKNKCPSTLDLIGKEIPISEDKRKGKFMLRKIRGSMIKEFGREIDLTSVTKHIKCTDLEALRELIMTPTPQLT